jgi:hypothetical protein
LRRDARLDQLESHVALSRGVGFRSHRVQVNRAPCASSRACHDPNSRRYETDPTGLVAGHPTPPEGGRGALVNEINRNMINGW